MSNPKKPSRYDLVQSWLAAQLRWQGEANALRADNERLRKAMERAKEQLTEAARFCGSRLIRADLDNIYYDIDAALASPPPADRDPSGYRGPLTLKRESPQFDSPPPATAEQPEVGKVITATPVFVSPGYAALVQAQRNKDASRELVCTGCGFTTTVGAVGFGDKCNCTERGTYVYKE